MSEPLIIGYEVLDTSMLQLCHAICKRNREQNIDNQVHIIEMEELRDHLTAYIEAGKKYDVYSHYRDYLEDDLK